MQYVCVIQAVQAIGTTQLTESSNKVVSSTKTSLGKGMASSFLATTSLYLLMLFLGYFIFLNGGGPSDHDAGWPDEGECKNYNVGMELYCGVL